MGRFSGIDRETRSRYASSRSTDVRSGIARCTDWRARTVSSASTPTMDSTGRDHGKTDRKTGDCDGCFARNWPWNRRSNWPRPGPKSSSTSAAIRQEAAEVALECVAAGRAGTYDCRRSRGAVRRRTTGRRVGREDGWTGHRRQQCGVQ